MRVVGVLKTNGRRLIAACGVAVIATAGGGAIPANGAPGDGGQVAVAPTVRLDSLGSADGIELYGLQGTQTLAFPVPRGLAPTALNASVELPPDVRAGVLAVMQGNRTISRIELPAADRAPISIPLTGAVVDGNAVTVLLRSQLQSPEGYCLADTNSPVRLSDASVVFTGEEAAPTVVADFLPPILQRLTVYVPARPSAAESDAAIRLAAAVVARYGQQSTDVDLAALPADQQAPGPSRPLERTVVVREGGPAGVSLLGTEGVPALLIGGSGNDLANQSRLLSSNMSRLALASKAVAGPLKSSPQLPGDQTTIRQLGQPGVNATALKPQVSIGLDQTRLGRPVRDLRVQLKGTYTPLPASVAGQVTASVGGQRVASWPTDANGTIDRWVDVPNALLTRYTNLDVAIDLSGNTGRCGEFQPVTLTIDGATTVQSRAAEPPTPAGLQSLPQALMPALRIGIGADAFADSARALTIVEGMQRLSSLPLATSVGTFAEVLDAKQPALLIAADGWSDDGVELPVSAAQGGELAVTTATGDSAETLTLDPAVRLGSVQTVVADSRTLVIATSNGSAAQLDSLLDWLDTDKRRWAKLDGAAVISAQGQQPVVVGADDVQPEPEVIDARAAGPWWVAGGAAVAAVAALAAWLVVRRRRRA